MAYSQAQVDAIANLISADPVPPVPPLQRLTPRTDALESSQAAQDAALALLSQQYSSLNLRENALDGRAGALVTRAGLLETSQSQQDAKIAANTAAIATVKAHDDGQDAAITAAATAANAERLRNNSQDTSIAALSAAVASLQAEQAKRRVARVTAPSLLGLALSDVTVTWPTAFADANYTVTVSVQQGGALAGIVVDWSIVGQTASGITVRVKNLAVSAQSPVIHATAIHD